MIDLGSVTAVDIPGFGYMASTSKKDIEEMKKTVIHRLEEWHEDILVAVLIVDVSLFRELVDRWEMREEIPIDIEFYTFLSEIAADVIVLANKLDKLRRKQRPVELEYLREKLRIALPHQEPTVIPASASKKIGIAELKMRIESILASTELMAPDW